MSSPTITHANAHSPNHFTAAYPVITLPTTPTRPAPNSAKKRTQLPDLSRPTATPGHGAKMSMIFRNAANSLQGSVLPPHQKSSNIKKSRLPLLQARGTKFGSTYQDDAMVSPGLNSPSKIERHPGEPCESKWALSEVTSARASGVGPHYSPPTHFVEDGRATLQTITDQYFGAATGDGGMCLDETLRVSSASSPLHNEEWGKEPISSGFATPIGTTPGFVENPEEVKYPIPGNWRSLRSRSNVSSFGSDNDDLHSTHGVPLILPFPSSDAGEAPRSDIDTWLNEVVEGTTFGISSLPKQSCDREDLLMNDAPLSQNVASTLSPLTRERVLSSSKPKQDMQSPSRASSNKENVSPPKSLSSPPRPPAHHHLQARIPSRFCQKINTQATFQPTTALHPAQPPTPQGDLSLPPRQRKRPRIDGTASCAAARPGTPTDPRRRDFTIHEERIAGALAQLSPDVERHRRGRGPRRERCVSYWDEDILQGEEPMDVDGDGETTMRKGRRVLGESKEAVELTREKPFVEEARSAGFEFTA